MYLDSSVKGLRDHIWTPVRGCAINAECWTELRLQSYLRPLWGAHTLRAMRESRARGKPIDGHPVVCENSAQGYAAHLKRGVPISGTGLSWTLRVMGYETYRLGALSGPAQVPHAVIAVVELEHAAEPLTALQRACSDHLCLGRDELVAEALVRPFLW